MKSLSELLAVARPHMVAFFANPPEGLCCGPAYQAAAIASIDRVIAEGDDAPELVRRHAVEQADRVAAYDEWEIQMRAFPTLRRY